MLERLLSNPIVFLCFFVCMWCLASYMVSLLGGWYAISKKYRRQETANGRLYFFTSMNVGIGTYASCLFIRVGEKGLDISVFLPFRFFHPPLLIPWNAFDSCKRTRLFFIERLQLMLRDPKCVLCFRGA